jgi:hypothetical protein
MDEKAESELDISPIVHESAQNLSVRYHEPQEEDRLRTKRGSYQPRYPVR